MPDAIITAKTEMSLIVPELWSTRFYEVLLAELPFNSIINHDYEGEIANLGDTVKITSFGEFAEDAVVLGEGERNDAQGYTPSQQNLEITDRVALDFIVTNRASLQSLPFVDKLKEMAVYAINKKLQALILAAISPSASEPDNSISYTTGTTLDLAKILEAKELLDDQSCPLTDRTCVLGSAQLNDLFLITGLTSTDFGASNAPLLSGNLPSQLLGFMPKFTTLVENTSYWFHNSFMTLATQQGMSTQEYDLGVDGKRAKRINNDTLVGRKQLDNTRVVTIS